MIFDETHFINFDGINSDKSRQEIFCELCLENDLLRPYGCKFLYCEAKQKREIEQKELKNATTKSDK
jgi:hypothetical protein